MTQATEIRKIVIKFLNDKEIVEPVSLKTEVLGIQYKNLKRMLLDERDEKDKRKFTEGAVIGTLNTLTSRNPNIKKIKTEKGTFFFDYKSYKNLGSITGNTDLLENDIKNIEGRLNELLTDVRNTIRNSKSRVAIEKNNSNVYRIEMNYLSEVLNHLTELRSITDSYENDKLINDEKKELNYGRY